MTEYLITVSGCIDGDWNCLVDCAKLKIHGGKITGQDNLGSTWQGTFANNEINITFDLLPHVKNALSSIGLTNKFRRSVTEYELANGFHDEILGENGFVTYDVKPL